MQKKEAAEKPNYNIPSQANTLTHSTMYFAFIYDHRYMKNDRDFYGDAIICFYPAERKESVSKREREREKLVLACLY